MIKDNQSYNDNVEPNTEFLRELKSKLPEYFSENGEFDIDKFKNNLKKNNINELKDGYQLDFIGKDYARRQSGELPLTVVVPDNNQNENEGKNSKNLFFSGDNIEVLRHMQSAYENSIDIIYIDPPYNTGKKDFTYPDKFEYTDEKIQEIFGMDDSEINRFKSIKGSSSHSAWLTFMYPRIVLAKRLMTEDGTIFVSIDDNEVDNLRLIMNEIFGENNRTGVFIQKRTDTPANISSKIKQSTEYVLAYMKRRDNVKYIGNKKFSSSNNGLLNQDNNYSTLVFPSNTVKTKLKNGTYKKGKYYSKKYEMQLLDDVIVKDGIFVTAVPMVAKFKWSQSYLNSQIKKGTEISIVSKSFSPSYEKKNYDPETPQSLIDRNVGVKTNEEGSDEILKLFSKNVFTNPKPTSLIKYLINFVSKENMTVLDFFAGSSTTADAVMQLNKEDGKNRKFIMVQIPEKISENNFDSIDDISMERIKRSYQLIKNKGKFDIDGSFKHYNVVNLNDFTINEIEKIDDSSIKLFNDVLQSLSSQSLGVKGSATGKETVLSTWILKDGYKMDTQISNFYINDYECSLVDDEILYLINDGWNSGHTKELLNMIGNFKIRVNTIILFGYSFNIAEIKELEIGLKQLDMNVNLLKRY